jgi:hypothetical protein
MSKKNFSFLVIGVVAALGLACVPSPEAPEVPSEPTVAEIEEQMAELESHEAFLLSEMAKIGLVGEWAEDDPSTKWVACGNQFTPETKALAIKNLERYWEGTDSSDPIYKFKTMTEQHIRSGQYRWDGPWRPLCRALLDEYETLPLIQEQLDLERVEAQIREVKAKIRERE